MTNLSLSKIRNHYRATARRPLDQRVSIGTSHGLVEGWSLNASDGGLRVLVIHEDAAALGEMAADVRVVIGEGDQQAERDARIVWRDLRDGGAVIGLAFVPPTTG